MKWSISQVGGRLAGFGGQKKFMKHQKKERFFFPPSFLPSHVNNPVCDIGGMLKCTYPFHQYLRFLICRLRSFG